MAGEFESNPLTFNDSFSLTNPYPDYGDLFVVKINPEGLVQWAVSAGGNDSDYGMGIATNRDGKAFITGDFSSTSISFGTTTLVNANSTNNSTDYFVAMLNSTTGVIETSLHGSYSIYPNPATDEFEVKSPEFEADGATIELYDLNGRKLLERQIPKGSREITVDVRSLQSGMYFCRVTIGDETAAKKLVIKK